MNALRRKSGRMALLAAAGALAFSAAGCREDEAAQRIAVPDPTPIELMPEPMALPYAEAAPVSWTGPDAGYRFAERAYGLEEAFYDAPPDYAFDYGGVEPWAWETADDWAMYAEPWETGYRYYYYEPGAAYPYFVRDGLYGYGFDPAGALVSLIDADGDYLPADRFAEAAPLAGRYWLHGRDLRNAAAQARRRPVPETAWIQRAPQVRRASEPWLQAARGDGDWRAWRERSGAKELKRFAREDRRREREAEAWRRDARRLAAQQIAEAPAAAAGLPEVQARRDMALAQREQLRAQRDQARAHARAEGAQRQAQAAQRQAQAERRFAQQQAAEARQQARAQAQQAREQARQQARAAEDHARQAAAQVRAEQRAQPRPERGPDRAPKAERPDKGPQGGHDRGPKADRGGGKKD